MFFFITILSLLARTVLSAGLEVPGVTSHRNNVIDIGVTMTTDDWNHTFQGMEQWMGSFTFLNTWNEDDMKYGRKVEGNGLIAITIASTLYLLDPNTGEKKRTEPASGWSQVQGSLTPNPPDDRYVFVVEGQAQPESMLAEYGSIYVYPKAAGNVWFNSDYVLQGKNLIYLDHSGPCRGPQKINTTLDCAWLWSRPMSHFDNWRITDIPDANYPPVSITKDSDDILYLMDGSTPTSTTNNRLWKIDADDGSIKEIFEFKQPFYRGSSKLSVSNIKTKGLNNYYFAQAVTNSRNNNKFRKWNRKNGEVHTLDDGWYLFAYSKDDNKMVWSVPLGDAPDKNDGCFEVTISETGETVYLTCQNYGSSEEINTLFSVDVASGKVNFQKSMKPYTSCGYVTESLNGYVVVTCAANSLPEVKKRKESSPHLLYSRRSSKQTSSSSSSDSSPGILILKKKDGSLYQKITGFEGYLGLRPMLDIKNNMYYCTYGGSNTESLCYRKNLK